MRQAAAMRWLVGRWGRALSACAATCNPNTCRPPVTCVDHAAGATPAPSPTASLACARARPPAAWCARAVRAFCDGIPAQRLHPKSVRVPQRCARSGAAPTHPPTHPPTPLTTVLRHTCSRRQDGEQAIRLREVPQGRHLLQVLRPRHLRHLRLDRCCRPQARSLVRVCWTDVQLQAGPALGDHTAGIVAVALCGGYAFRVRLCCCLSVHGTRYRCLCAPSTCHLSLPQEVRAALCRERRRPRPPRPPRSPSIRRLLTAAWRSIGRGGT